MVEENRERGMLEKGGGKIPLVSGGDNLGRKGRRLKTESKKTKKSKKDTKSQTLTA